MLSRRTLLLTSLSLILPGCKEPTPKKVEYSTRQGIEYFSARLRAFTTSPFSINTHLGISYDVDQVIKSNSQRNVKSQEFFNTNLPDGRSLFIAVIECSNINSLGQEIEDVIGKKLPNNSSRRWSINGNKLIWTASYDPKLTSTDFTTTNLPTSQYSEASLAGCLYSALLHPDYNNVIHPNLKEALNVAIDQNQHDSFIPLFAMLKAAANPQVSTLVEASKYQLEIPQESHLVFKLLLKDLQEKINLLIPEEKINQMDELDIELPKNVQLIISLTSDPKAKKAISARMKSALDYARKNKVTLLSKDPTADLYNKISEYFKNENLSYRYIPEFQGLSPLALNKLDCTAFSFIAMEMAKEMLSNIPDSTSTQIRIFDEKEINTLRHIMNIVTIKGKSTYLDFSTGHTYQTANDAIIGYGENLNHGNYQGYQIYPLTTEAVTADVAWEIFGLAREFNSNQKFRIYCESGGTLILLDPEQNAKFQFIWDTLSLYLPSNSNIKYGSTESHQLLAKYLLYGIPTE